MLDFISKYIGWCYRIHIQNSYIQFQYKLGHTLIITALPLSVDEWKRMFGHNVQVNQKTQFMLLWMVWIIWNSHRTFLRVVLVNTLFELYISRIHNPSFLSLSSCFCVDHDDVIKWNNFLRYWPFVRGIHRSPVNSPHKGQWRGALMCSLICVWTNDWINNREVGDLRLDRGHYDVIVMFPAWLAELGPNMTRTHFGYSQLVSARISMRPFSSTVWLIAAY